MDTGIPLNLPLRTLSDGEEREGEERGRGREGEKGMGRRERERGVGEREGRREREGRGREGRGVGRRKTTSACTSTSIAKTTVYYWVNVCLVGFFINDKSRNLMVSIFYCS